MGSGGAAAWVESPLALALAVFASVSVSGVVMVSLWARAPAGGCMVYSAYNPNQAGVLGG